MNLIALSRKKLSLFFSGPSTKALPLLPSSLVAKLFRGFFCDFFLELQKKVVFFLSSQGQTPPPFLSGRATNFFAASFI